MANGAHLMRIMESPMLSLLNMAPNITLALGIMPLASMPIPVPTISPIPSDCFMLAASMAVSRPNFCPPISMPKSPMTAPANHTPMNTRPMIYPMATSIGDM